MHLYVATGRYREAGGPGGGAQAIQAPCVIRATLQADPQPAPAGEISREPVRGQQVVFISRQPQGQAAVETVLKTGVGQGILTLWGIAPPARDQCADLGVACVVPGQ